MRVDRWFLILFTMGAALAHPLGNLSVNHYMRLEPGAHGVDATYVLDLAEIPSFELVQSWGLPRDAAKNVLQAKAREAAARWVENLSFTEDGKKLAPKIDSVDASIGEGTAALPLIRVTTRLHLPAQGGRFEYEDRNYPTKAGWREIVIKPEPGAEVSRASNDDVDRTRELTSYPRDTGNAPRDVRAVFEWKVSNEPVITRMKPVISAVPQPDLPLPAGPPVTPDAKNAQPQPSGKSNDALSRLLRTDKLSWPVLATLIGLAFWFGALHALEPGHGKTMVAAYLVGARGTPKHAAVLGGMVTFTHTISVFLIGIVTLFLSRYIMPDRISKVLGIVSGVSIIWIGGILLSRRWRALRPHHHHHHHHHEHEHAHGHEHHHHPHDHAHVHPHEHHHHDHAPEQGHVHHHDHGAFTHTHDGHTHTHVPEGEISMSSLIALGASGGLVPCPSALILLLSAISLGKIGLGLILLVAFSLGLAIVLTSTGLVVLYAKNLLPETKRKDNAFFRYMPVFSAAAIVLIGVLMTGVSLGLVPATRFIG